MREEKSYIYGLHEVGSDVFQYIGKTNNVAPRLSSHRYASLSRRVREWMKTFPKKTQVKLTIIEETTPDLVDSREAFYIREWANKNPELLNTMGGERRTCLRCGHNWRSNLNTTPKWCPKCKSGYWNKPKTS